MEPDTSLHNDDDSKQDILWDPLGDVKGVYISDEEAVSPCFPKFGISFEYPFRDVENVHISEERAASLCAPKVEVSSDEDPFEDVESLHVSPYEFSSEDPLGDVKGVYISDEEAASPRIPNEISFEVEDKGELSPGCPEILPDTCPKEEIGQQVVINSQASSVDLSIESESPDDPPGGDVDGEVSNSDTKQKFTCTICNKGFGQKRALIRHQSIHLEYGPYNCQVCLKQFTARSSLKSHLATHTGEKKFQCDICSKNFVRRTTLDAHLDIIHKGQKRFTCPVCSYKFSRQGDFQRHLQTHTGSDRKFECPICHKLLTRNSNLKTHILTHSGEKNYECSTCSKAFLRADDLKRHMKVHTGEKNFECNICNRKFIQRCNLNVHYLTHSGERKYRCSTCSKAFIRPDDLKRHLKLHTAEKTFECSICNKKFAQRCYLKTHFRTHKRNSGQSTKSRPDLQTNVDDDFVGPQIITNEPEKIMIGQPVFDGNVVIPHKATEQKLIKPLRVNGEDHAGVSTKYDSDSHADFELEQKYSEGSVYSEHRNSVNTEHNSDSHTNIVGVSDSGYEKEQKPMVLYTISDECAADYSDVENKFSIEVTCLEGVEISAHSVDLHNIDPLPELKMKYNDPLPDLEEKYIPGDLQGLY